MADIPSWLKDGGTRRAWLEPVRVDRLSGSVLPLPAGMVRRLQLPAIFAYDSHGLLLTVEHGGDSAELTDVLSQGKYARLALLEGQEITEALLVLRSVRVAIRLPAALEWTCQDEFNFEAEQEAAGNWLARILIQPKRFGLEVVPSLDEALRQFLAKFV